MEQKKVSILVRCLREAVTLDLGHLEMCYRHQVSILVTCPYFRGLIVCKIIMCIAYTLANREVYKPQPK